MEHNAITIGAGLALVCMMVGPYISGLQSEDSDKALFVSAPMTSPAATESKFKNAKREVVLTDENGCEYGELTYETGWHSRHTMYFCVCPNGSARVETTHTSDDLFSSSTWVETTVTPPSRDGLKQKVQSYKGEKGHNSLN